MPAASQYVVSDALAGTRLDVFLARSDPDRSRGLFQRAIEEGRVRLNGRRAKKWERVAVGDTVDIEPLLSLAAPPVPDPAVPFVVVHEDGQLLVVDKPAGVPTHPHRPDERGTLANGLIARYPDLAGVGPQPLEPGLVHRLDTQTSGLLVAARTPAAFRALATAFAERRVEKVYLALVLGTPPATATITTPIGHHPTDPRRMVVEGDPAGPPRSPRPAATHVAVRRRLGPYTEVEVRIDTGRMHQIRVHLAAIGHPVAGDALYEKPAEFARDRLGLARPFLHAARIAFDHPADGRRVEFSAPLPPDLVTALARVDEAGAGEPEGETAAARVAAPARRARRPKAVQRPPGRTFIRRPGGARRPAPGGPEPAGGAGARAPEPPVPEPRGRRADRGAPSRERPPGRRGRGPAAPRERREQGPQREQREPGARREWRPREPRGKSGGPPPRRWPEREPRGEPERPFRAPGRGQADAYGGPGRRGEWRPREPHREHGGPAGRRDWRPREAPGESGGRPPRRWREREPRPVDGRPSRPPERDRGEPYGGAGRRGEWPPREPRREYGGPPGRRRREPGARRKQGAAPGSEERPPARREQGGRFEGPARGTWRHDGRRAPRERGAQAEDPRPRPGELFGDRPERRRGGDRQERDARRAGAFATTVGGGGWRRSPSRDRAPAGDTRSRARGEGRDREPRGGPAAGGERRPRPAAARRGGPGAPKDHGDRPESRPGRGPRRGPGGGSRRPRR